MLSDKDFERYNRQIILKGFGLEAQEKLAAAKVLVIGAGGLGCPALQYLAAAGVGRIGIVDDDVVSISNLHRQILYKTGDAGLAKAEIAAERLRDLNPGITVITHQVRLAIDNVLDVIRSYDFILDGTDNFSSRYMINDACVLLNKPLVYGAVAQYEGQVAVFNVDSENSRATNYRDLFPYPPEDGEVPNCAEAGVLGVLPGIIGTMQAAELIKLITGIGKPLINKLLTYGILSHHMYEVSLEPTQLSIDLIPGTEAAFLKMNYHSACRISETSIVEIDAEQFETLLGMPSTIAVDVREKWETPAVTRFEHRQIPMSEFEDSIGEIEEEHIILFCQHGIRSLNAAELVQEVLGTSRQVYSLKGGLARWGTKLL